MNKLEAEKPRVFGGAPRDGFFGAMAPAKLGIAVALACTLALAGGFPGKAKLERLDKVVSLRSGVSRADARKLITGGRVTVEGAQVRSIGTKVAADAAIAVTAAGRGASAPGGELGSFDRVLAYHKPVGVHSVVGDPQGRRDLESELGRSILRRYHPVGRLDQDTSGLLLLSSDGDLTHRLLHPKYEVPRLYRATVRWERGIAAGDEGYRRRALPAATVEELRERLAAGVETTDGTFPAELVDARMPDDGTEPEGEVLLRVREGKYRMVRRLLFNAGHEVLALHRVQYGGVALEELAGASHLVDVPEGEVVALPNERVQECFGPWIGATGGEG